MVFGILASILMVSVDFATARFSLDKFTISKDLDTSNFAMVGSDPDSKTLTKCAWGCKSQFNCNIFYQYSGGCEYYSGHSYPGLQDSGSGEAHVEPYPLAIAGPSKYSKEVHVMTPNGTVCKRLPDFPLVNRYSGRLITVDDSKIFLIAGKSTDTSSNWKDVWMLDVSLPIWSWTKKASSLRYLCFEGVYLYGREIFTFSGYACSGSGYYHNIDAYHVDKDSWRPLTGVTTPLAASVLNVVPFSKTEALLVYYGNIYKFDFVTETFKPDNIPATFSDAAFVERIDLPGGAGTGLISAREGSDILYFLDFANMAAGHVALDSSKTVQGNAFRGCSMKGKGYDMYIMSDRKESWLHADFRSQSFIASTPDLTVDPATASPHCAVISSRSITCDP